MLSASAAEAGDPWALDASDYPLGGSGAEQLRFLVRAAILAPSTHNTQPWRFRIVGDDTVEVWLDSRRSLTRIDPAGRQRLMSCGAALFHLRVGLRRFGARDQVEYLPEPAQPELVARVRRGVAIPPPGRDLDLFGAIRRRRTNRAPFLTRPIAPDLSDELIAEAAAEGAWLVRLHPHDKLEVAWLIETADRKQFADPTFREEMARWLVPRGSDRRDGIPMVRKDLPSALPLAGLALLRRFDLGSGIAARERELATGSPMLAVLGTGLDGPHDWIAAGEAMEAVLLRATHLGLAASFLNQAIEEGELRDPIARAASTRGFAQLILRFGWGAEIAPTPRRGLDEVLFD
jgi:nitroreductase